MEALITILWIDDNPLIGGITAEKFLERHPELKAYIDINSKRLFPAITLDNGEKDKTGATVKPLVKGDEYRFFRLRIVQNLEEAKEYFSAIAEIEDKHGPKKLGEYAEVIPNIVAFDYKMMEGNNVQGGNNIPYGPRFQELRKFYNPVYELLQPDRNPFFDREENEDYNNNSFLLNLNKIKTNILPDGGFQVDKEQLKDDELGLFAGISITRFFKNHPCVGVPITANKASTDRLNAYAKFFEWFNAREFEEVFSHESRGSKDWKCILIPAVKHLRSRLLGQLRNEKLIINTDDLFKVYDGIMGTMEEKDKYLVYTNAYGTRKVPLDGLFFDIENENKQREIHNYTEQILEVFEEKTQISPGIYLEAKKHAAKLWDVYSTIEGDLEKRYKLSEYLSWQIGNEKMLKEKIIPEDFASLKLHFGYDPILNILTKNTLELTDIKDLPVRRLVVLFIYVKLLGQEERTLRQLEHLDKDGAINSFREIIEVSLSSRDLLLALFPVPAKRPIMDIHMDLVPKKNRPKGSTLYETQRQVLRDINIGLSNNLKLDKISPSERYLLKLYANENNLIIPNHIFYGS